MCNLFTTRSVFESLNFPSKFLGLWDETVAGGGEGAKVTGGVSETWCRHTKIPDQKTISYTTSTFQEMPMKA